MITGVHSLIYTRHADAVRELFRDTIGWPHADTGGGWLIFALPPTELGVHPTDGPAVHELTLMCDDIRATIDDLTAKGVEFVAPVTDEGWGLVTRFRLAGDETMMLYEPRHPSPLAS